MSLVSQLNDYINAAFSGLWVQTVEPEEAERELVEHSRRFPNWTVAVWDIARGLRLPTSPNTATPEVADPFDSAASKSNRCTISCVDNAFGWFSLIPHPLPFNTHGNGNFLPTMNGTFG